MPEIGTDIQSRARTHLANERTFNAWFRTGLAMLALGLAAGQLLAPDVIVGVPVVRLIGTGAMLTGALVILLGLYRYRVNRARIDLDDFRPAGNSIYVVALATIPVTVLAIAFIWLLRS